MKFHKIPKSALSEKVAEQLRALIINGTLPPETRLVEREIADLINVSRTPMREAFFELAREGLIEKTGNRGFAVSKFNADEVRESYKLIGLIERFLLEDQGDFSETKLKQLKAINNKLLKNSNDAEKFIETDNLWHSALLAESENPKTLRILFDLKKVSARYEIAFFNNLGNPFQSYAEHDGIIRELASGNKKRAGKLLESHWQGTFTLLKNLGKLSN